MKDAQTRERSVVRRTLHWWFRPPQNPYVTVNFAVDVGDARAWLATLGEPRVSLNALVVATIGRVLREFPTANARIVGRHTERVDRVGIAMPVNLLGHSAEADREVSMAVVPDIDRMSLREVAAATTKTVRAEREGTAQNDLIRRILGLAERVPGPVLHGVLETIDRAHRHRPLARRLYEQVPVTTALSNAGAAMRATPGMLFRGADIAIPPRLVHIGTFWGLSAVQDEVVPFHGVPTVRPMLPVLFLFDHRLVDGVVGSRIATRFGAILANPAAEFGSDGAQIITPARTP